MERYFRRRSRFKKTTVYRIIEPRRGKEKDLEEEYEEALKYINAEWEGVEVREVNPAYTSVIGKHKHVSYYHITIHQAAALVVARRGRGFYEYLHGLKTPLLKAMEVKEMG